MQEFYNRQIRYEPALLKANGFIEIMDDDGEPYLWWETCNRKGVWQRVPGPGAAWEVHRKFGVPVDAVRFFRVGFGYWQAFIGPNAKMNDPQDTAKVGLLGHLNSSKGLKS
jgi:hypothetical protein